ncbi:hypothetical protein J1N35_039210 [Gossypium stocksii]|uniref:ABC transmembrane type-1 domain-containing protein n=1 Tax=Gossypium stocksii TaxID=47602 RepID=A0A9D3UNK4_9ROSI|nr:hypothetical protein J1N35_039210 [Gossypium stocksii]
MKRDEAADKEEDKYKNNGSNKKKKTSADDQKVPFYKLFPFADRLYMFFVTVLGIIAAVANGLTQPFMTLIFGQMINSFSGADQSGVVKAVSKVENTTFFLLELFSSKWLLL